MALRAGSAVLTLNEGDVATLVSPDYRAENQGDYFEKMFLLVEDDQVAAAWKFGQQNYFKNLVDQDLFLSSLRGMVSLAFSRFADRRGIPLSLIIDGL
jgi:hypothetical protein